MFGNPEKTSGGRALKFYSSMRLEIRRAAPIKDGTDIVGNHTYVKVVKNKLSAPFKRAEFDIIFGEGISKTGSLIDVALDQDLIVKSGVWFSYGETRLGQGRENAKRFFENNPEIALEIEEKIRESGILPNGKTLKTKQSTDKDEENNQQES